MNITIGAELVKTITVETKDSAKSLGSGGLDVFGTPAMIALMENTALSLLKNYLPEGSDSVGTAVDAKHLKASPIGAKISCKATITAVEGRKVDFEIVASDESGDTVGTCKHGRFIVDVERFMSKIK